MIVDSSAIIAILRAEPSAKRYTDALENERRPKRISTANYLEAAIVVDADKDPVLSRRFDDFLRTADIKLEPVTARQAFIARQAYRDFGKGSGHPARLNFGDCFSYALAIDLDEPLLYQGNNFAATGVATVPTP